ncbi:MAG: SDR family NAD(P)-dependent oxidoreductase [Acidimicrobiales bacterium]
MDLRFDGRVAVVTGAGRGLGRSYALLLAERGASVVVNDLGGEVDGTGADTTPAARVVAEIEGAGGTAVADASDVSTEPGATALIATAVEQLGRLDVLVANAGIMRWAEFPDVDADDLARHLAVHVGGSFHTARAAWPHLVAQGYGRIVLTTSTGLLGVRGNTSYAAAKGAVLGLARSLALAGAPHDIKVNCIAPAASTRMAGGHGPELPEEEAAPMAAYLAHESCPVSGETYTAGGGRFARLFIGSTEGHVPAGEGPATIEDVASHWAEINDPADFYVPADLIAWSTRFLSHRSAR